MTIVYQMVYAEWFWPGSDLLLIMSLHVQFFALETNHMKLNFHGTCVNCCHRLVAGHAVQLLHGPSQLPKSCMSLRLAQVLLNNSTSSL